MLAQFNKLNYKTGLVISKRKKKKKKIEDKPDRHLLLFVSIKTRHVQHGVVVTHVQKIQI